MKILIRSLLLCISLFFLGGCGEEDTPVYTPFEQQYGNVDAVWETAHQNLFNFKGNPLSVVEMEESMDEDLSIYNVSRKYVFDNKGHLLEYNPLLGIPNEASTFLGSWGVSGESVKYIYDYDTNGKLKQITAAELGGESIIYVLTYGDHTTYVPLPLPFGNLPVFLIKGLKKVVGDDGFSYEYNGQSASFESSTWMGTSRTEYTFKDAYPSKCITQLNRGGEVLKQQETIYAFGEKGLLLGTSVIMSEGGEELQRISNTYATPWLQIKQELIQQGLVQEEYNYSYTENGYLASASRNDSEGALASVAIMPYECDAKGNWLNAERMVEGYFNDYWPEGTMKLKQIISY